MTLMYENLLCYTHNIFSDIKKSAYIANLPTVKKLYILEPSIERFKVIPNVLKNFGRYFFIIDSAGTRQFFLPCPRPLTWASLPPL